MEIVTTVAGGAIEVGGICTDGTVGMTEETGVGCVILVVGIGTVDVAFACEVVAECGTSKTLSGLLSIAGVTL